MTKAFIGLSPKRPGSSINAIPVLQDNIVWVWTLGNKAVVVDPAITSPVENWLINNNYTLCAVLQTHHHSDHIGGTQGLINQWPESPVIAAASDAERIPFQNISVKDGDKISLLENTLEVIEVTGHTRGHIAYFLPAKEDTNELPALFCGDTLFAAGCGRLFEGSPKEMFLSLQKLKRLPENTRVFCAHEYTHDNLLWANSICPDNKEIEKRLKEVNFLREKGETTLPSNMSLEKKTNLFLIANTLEEFTNLRRHKDQWKKI